MAAPIIDACAFFGPWPQHDELALPNLLDAMAPSNITRSLALSTAGIFYDFRVGNAATLEAARAHPGAIFPVATLDPRAYPACLSEAENCAKAGFRLFRFFPSHQGWPIRYAPFRELLQRCDALGTSVAVEVSHHGEITELADALAFTQSPVLLAGVTAPLLGEAMAVMRSAPKFYLETTHLAAPGALETVAAEVPHGSSRLIFASYAPLRYLSAALGPILASSLTGEQKSAILGGNLQILLTKKA